MKNTITIEGKEYPLKFDLNAIAEIEKLSGQNALRGLQMSVGLFKIIIHAGIKSATGDSPGPEEIGKLVMNKKVIAEITEALTYALGADQQEQEGESQPAQ